jgi:phosphoglycolate phosphatase-like HAD superfamily hydrolase
MVGAFAKLHARDDVFEGTSFAGMTDRAIARHGLIGLETLTPSEAEIDRVLDCYLELLESELESTAGYRVLPGVADLLAWLADTPLVAVGLGTGNVRRGAFAKLSRGDLDGAFSFGGFGCDAEDRIELLRAGAKRGADALRLSIEECSIVVIGDTPKDVAAARGLGARPIGVGTGGYTASDLRNCGAESAFDTLEDPLLRAILLG